MTLTELCGLPREEKMRLISGAAGIEKRCFDDAWDNAAFESFSLSDDFLLLLARLDDGTPVGYVCGRIAADECELYRIAVMPEHRKNGIAARLMDFFLSACEKRRIQTVFLEVRSKNLPARALYKKCGFNEISLRRGYYPDDDAVILSKKI